MTPSPAVKNAYVSIFTAVVREERIEQFLSALSRVLPHSAAEDGILRFEVFRNQASPNAFTIVDLYRDQAAYESHTKTPHIALAESGLSYDIDCIEHHGDKKTKEGQSYFDLSPIGTGSTFSSTI